METHFALIFSFRSEMFISLLFLAEQNEKYKYQGDIGIEVFRFFI